MIRNEQIQSKIYSGVLGKAIGVRLGAPIEPYQWDYQRILKSYGNLQGYVKDSRRFAADDDTNGPIFFVRSLLDRHDLTVTEASVGEAWLNYARDGQGMFWWGGEGISTEHTAYNHLKAGIEPPLSGKSAQNGKALSEQVGGQIFIDSWGLIHPCNIEKAMHDAAVAASVSHDGEALEGARFIAGMIAGAFEWHSIEPLVHHVLNRMNAQSEYVNVMQDIIRFYDDHPDDFREAYDYVLKNYSYDHYEGACHVIPNACIVLIGLLYGNGSFSRSIEITCMCGWDTDSNAGVVGTILGVYGGLESIPHHYRNPINDIIIGSSMSPTLNIVNVPDFAELLFNLSQGISQEKYSIDLKFKHQGSSCGLCIENDFRLVKDQISLKSLTGYDVLIDNLVAGDTASIYYQTFYQTSDFGDNRYDPVFAPLVYSGETVTITLKSEIDFIDALYGTIFVRTVDGTEYTGETIHLSHNELKTMQYIIPDTDGKLIKMVGIKFTTHSGPIDGNGLLGRIIITAFKVNGMSDYVLNHHSFEPGFIGNVAPFSNHRLDTVCQGSSIKFAASDCGIALTGDYFAHHVKLNTEIQNIVGKEVRLIFRAKGLENYYYLRICEESIEIKHRHHLTDAVLSSHAVSLDFTEGLVLSLDVTGNTVQAFVNNVGIESDQIRNEYGHFGFGACNSAYSLESVCIASLKYS